MNINPVSPYFHRTFTQNNGTEDKFQTFREKLGEALRKKFDMQKSSEGYEKSSQCEHSIRSIISDELWEGVEDLKSVSDNIFFGMEQIIKGVQNFDFYLPTIGISNNSLCQNLNFPKTHLLLLEALANKEDIKSLSLYAINIATNGNFFYSRLPLTLNEISENNWSAILGVYTTPEDPISMGLVMKDPQMSNVLKAEIHSGYLYKKLPITTDELIDKITEIIKNNKDIRIKNLILDKNEINPYHIHKLAKSLSGKEVFKLSFTCNPSIMKAGIRILCQYLKNIKVCSLHFDLCSLDFESAELLINNLPETIQHLDLSYNIRSEPLKNIISSMPRPTGSTLSI